MQYLSSVAFVMAVAVAAASAGCGRRVASDDGAAVFAEACAPCHGPGGVPDPGIVARLGVKNLTEPELHARLSDADIVAQIRNGSQNQHMPAFAGALTDAQVAALVRHIRGLNAAARAR
jgi:quinoprotein glucose dehydrogenase